MNQCDFPRCRGYDYLIYLGKPICQKHWEQICEANSKTEKRLLKKIGMIRDNTGSVVPITTTEKS